MDPEDTLDLRVVGVVHSSWAPAPEPHSDSMQLDSELLDVHTTENATEQPTSGLVAEPEGAYFPDEDLYYFDASQDAWFDRDDNDCFFGSHDDWQGAYVRGRVSFTMRARILSISTNGWHQDLKALSNYD
jgi:hypothetical protein